MQSQWMNHPSLYEFAIGDMGDWLANLTENEVSEIKSALRSELHSVLSNAQTEWSLDLDTIALLNGLDPTPSSHLVLPITVHRSAVRAWLTNLNSMLPSANQLWIADNAELQFRCCTTNASGEWHTCGALALRTGSSQTASVPWVFSPTLSTTGAAVPVRIYLQVTWTCLLEEAAEGAMSSLASIGNGGGVLRAQPNARLASSHPNKGGRATPTRSSRSSSPARSDGQGKRAKKSPTGK